MHAWPGPARVLWTMTQRVVIGSAWPRASAGFRVLIFLTDSDRHYRCRFRPSNPTPLATLEEAITKRCGHAGESRLHDSYRPTSRHLVEAEGIRWMRLRPWTKLKLDGTLRVRSKHDVQSTRAPSRPTGALASKGAARRRLVARSIKRRALIWVYVNVVNLSRPAEWANLGDEHSPGSPKISRASDLTPDRRFAHIPL